MSAMEQKIGPQSDEDARHSEKQRMWVRDHFEPEARHNYGTVEGKLRLISTILDAGWIEPSETWKLQSLRITFGDALAQKEGLTWVTAEDEHGRTPSLQLLGTSIIVFPLTSISKRIERGEKINVRELFDDFCEVIDNMRKKGY